MYDVVAIKPQTVASRERKRDSSRGERKKKWRVLPRVLFVAVGVKRNNVNYYIHYTHSTTLHGEREITRGEREREK